MPLLAHAAAVLVALAPGAREEVGTIRAVAVGGAGFGVLPPGGDALPWFKGVPIWRAGGALEVDLAQGSVSSVELSIPVVALRSRWPFGPHELELAGWEVVPELRARIRLYTRLDLVLGVGLGMLFHQPQDWVNDTETQPSGGGETVLAWQASALVEWMMARPLSLRLGPSVIGQDNGPMYLAFTVGLSWLL
jgi:hypothetical protein